MLQGYHFNEPSSPNMLAKCCLPHSSFHRITSEFMAHYHKYYHILFSSLHCFIHRLSATNESPFCSLLNQCLHYNVFFSPYNLAFRNFWSLHNAIILTHSDLIYELWSADSQVYDQSLIILHLRKAYYPIIWQRAC